MELLINGFQSIKTLFLFFSFQFLVGTFNVKEANFLTQQSFW